MGSFAQFEKDRELWLGGKLRVGLTEKLRFDAEYQCRLQDHWKSRKQSLNEFGLRYAVTKWFRVKPAYRFGWSPDFNSNIRRWMVDLTFRASKKGFPLRLSNRIRAQREKQVNTAWQEFTLRNRLGLDYNASRLVDPFMSFEIFFAADEFADKRFRVGADWRLARPLRLATFYAVETQLQVRTPNREYILGVMAVYQFKIEKSEPANQ